ncbi:hypothetical protein HKD37_06G015015 [Glycine soja]
MSVFVLLAKEEETGDSGGSAATQCKRKIKATAELHGGGREVVSVVANYDTTASMENSLVHILKKSRSK